MNVWKYCCYVIKSCTWNFYIAVSKIITYLKLNGLEANYSPGFNDYMINIKYVNKTPIICKKAHFYQRIYYYGKTTYTFEINKD